MKIHMIIYGENDELILDFTSDDYDFGFGFNLQYCFVPKPLLHCNHDKFTMHHSIIYSHTCGSTYYSPMNCIWNISPNIEEKQYKYIILQFNKLEIDDKNVEINIYSSLDEIIFTTSNKNVNIKEIQLNKAIIIQDFSISIEFLVNKDAKLLSGWEIEYFTSEDSLTCNEKPRVFNETIAILTYTEPTGYIQDHYYGDFYDNDLDCSFLIHLENKTSTITILFDYFNVTGSYDVLEIYDGISPNFNNLISIYSEFNKPNVIQSKSNALYFLFRTDNKIINNGFKFYYSETSLLNCPLFCSNHGKCDNDDTNTCLCDDGFYGLSCEISLPPFIIGARFRDSNDAIQIDFNRDTNRGSMIGLNSTNLSFILYQSSIDQLGYKPLGIWVDDKTFLLRLGNEATILPNDYLYFKGNVIKEKSNLINDISFIPSLNDSIIQVLPPFHSIPPKIVIYGSKTIEIGKQNNLILDAIATYITGGRKPIYQWKINKICYNNTENCNITIPNELINYLQLQHDEKLIIPYYLLNNYLDFNMKIELSIVATNFLHITSEPYYFTFYTINQLKPQILFSTLRENLISNDENIFIRSNIKIKTINDDVLDQLPSDCNNIEFNWSIFDISECNSSLCDDNQINFPSSVVFLNTSELYIPSYSLSFNSKYRIELKVKYNENNYLYDYVYYTIKPFEFHVYPLGGNQYFSFNQEIQLSAEPIGNDFSKLIKNETTTTTTTTSISTLTPSNFTFNNNNSNSSLDIKYNWICKTNFEKDCKTFDNQLLNLNLYQVKENNDNNNNNNNNNNPLYSLLAPSSLKIPAFLLFPGIYNFYVQGTLYDGKNYYKSNYNSIQIQIVRNDNSNNIQLPKVRILPLLSQTYNIKHDVRKPLLLFADTIHLSSNYLSSIISYSSLQSFKSPEIQNITWSVISGDLQLNEYSIQNDNSIHSIKLIIKPNILQDGAKYKFKVSITDINQITNHADIEIQMNDSPTSSKLNVTPKMGSSLTFSVSGASDDPNDMPLKYVFGLIPKTCPELEKLKLNSSVITSPYNEYYFRTICPFIPLNDEIKIPKLQVYLPPGEYYPAVDIFDKIGSFRRIINTNELIQSIYPCPENENQLFNNVNQLLSILDILSCIHDFDGIRQLFNFACISLSCYQSEIPDSLYSIYFNEILNIQVKFDYLSYPTEINVDNQIKSFLLASYIPIHSSSILNNDKYRNFLLENVNLLSLHIKEIGFLRDDSTFAILSCISNLLDNLNSNNNRQQQQQQQQQMSLDFSFKNDTSFILNSIMNIHYGDIKHTTCDTISNEILSSNIQIQNQIQPISNILGSEIRSFVSSLLQNNENSSPYYNHLINGDETSSSSVFSSFGTSFSFPNNNIVEDEFSATANIDCISYFMVTYDFNFFDDGISKPVSIPTALSFTKNNIEYPVSFDDSSSNSAIIIQIPISESYPPDTKFKCASWNEDLYLWESNCDFIGISDDGKFYILSTTHLTTFSVLLDSSSGGENSIPSISSFSSFDSSFTGATEYFSSDDLDQYGNLRSSFTAITEIPTNAFDSSQSIYDIIQIIDDIDDENSFSRVFIWYSIGSVCIAIVFIIISIVVIEQRFRMKKSRKKRTLTMISKMTVPSLLSSTNGTNSLSSSLSDSLTSEHSEDTLI